MSVHSSDLKTASFLQERHSVPLDLCAQKLKRSVSSIKRSIACINEFLPESRQILITNNQAVFQMNYREYLDFVSSLAFQDFCPSRQERLHVMAIYAFLNFSLNMTHLYQTLYLSPGTKKKDSQAFSEWLEQYELYTEVLPRRGIRVLGSERRFRILVTDLLSKCLELDSNFMPTLRRANNPLQTLLASYFLVKADSGLKRANEVIRAFIDRTKCRISYASAKFLYLYLGCAFHRMDAGFFIPSVTPLDLSIRDYALIDDNTNENAFFNSLISSLDTDPPIIPHDNEKLRILSRELIESVQNHIITYILNDHRVYEDVYRYLHKCIIRNTQNFTFYDNKLEDTHFHYHLLYDVLKSEISACESSYQITISPSQIASLTLIFRTYTDKNKLAGRNQKRLVVVTNSSMEKILFFIGKMKLTFDVRLIDVININELHRIQNLSYDYLIVFSNRISMLLAENGYSSLKLNFYLTEDDLRLLEKSGFSTSRRKIRVSSFLNATTGMDRETLSRYLLSQYEDFFME